MQPTEAGEDRHPSRGRLARLARAMALVGLVLGILEAGLLYFKPRVAGLTIPDTAYVIWFIAPLVDMLAGAAVGLLLGLSGMAVGSRRFMQVILPPIAAGIGGAYLCWILDWFGIGAGVTFPSRPTALTAIEGFVVAFIVILGFTIFGPRRFNGRDPISIKPWLVFDSAVTAALVCGIIFYAVFRPPRPGAAHENSGIALSARKPSQPNIALIVLDTVRADHLTCYGYFRPTTPGLCALARRGVLFENAIAPSSWTLPSLTSIFTGLMPHQTGANWSRAPAPEPWTLARILQSKGFETAGFNANPYYGLAGWRLSEGFDLYDDDSTSIRHNLAVTFIGQSVLQWLYDRTIRFNQFNHRTADDLNRDILRWARRRKQGQPYFLFVNYMDAHRPYLPPAPFDHRFGGIPPPLLPRLAAALRNGRPQKPYTTAERAEMIDGYDNSLAYLDGRAASLIRFLGGLPGGGSTVFIITSDHGEGFGEHNAYDHGWNLYREALHVPLMIFGPGIPAGFRIQDTAPTRDLFATIIDLTLPELRSNRAIASATLRRLWSGGPSPAPQAVLSELDFASSGADPSMLSLTTAQWQIILNPGGRAELYDVLHDPGEQRNLAQKLALHPQDQAVLPNLRADLEAKAAYSLLPWRGIEYLSPLDSRAGGFIRAASEGRLKLPSVVEPPIGSAQAIFSHQPPSQLMRPPAPEEQNLRTLPYH